MRFYIISSAVRVKASIENNEPTASVTFQWLILWKLITSTSCTPWGNDLTTCISRRVGKPVPAELVVEEAMDVHHLLQLRPRVFWIWLQELETQNTFANGSDYICNSHPKCMITTSDTKTIEVFVVLTCSRQHWLVIVMLWLFYFKTNLNNLAPCSTNFTDRIFFR